MHFFVGDLARAESFYHQALGFDKVNWSFPGALFVSAGGYHHHVGLNTWAAGSPPATEEDARLLTWELRLPDRPSLDGVVAAMRRAGASVTPSGDGYLAADPWGIVVWLRPGSGVAAAESRSAESR
jgi:catechol 2,3-dioxygenase